MIVSPDLQALIDRAATIGQRKTAGLQDHVKERIERRIADFRAQLHAALSRKFSKLLEPLISIEFNRDSEVVSAAIALPVPAKDETFVWTLTKQPDSVFEDERWGIEYPWGGAEVIARADLRARLLSEFALAQAPDEE